MISISDIVEKLRNIVSGFVKPKDVVLPFEGLHVPSEQTGARDQEKEPPVSEEEALDRANDFIREAQQEYNSED